MSIRIGAYVRVSTDDQRDNGYSIDSQLRMIKEYCEKNNYDIVDVYDDGGYSGKNLTRPAMQRLIKDIANHKIERIVAIKTDRLTRNNYDGFWLLNYCEDHDVKIELILEPYDISTANGEMMFGMNLVFGNRERKEIGARTKRALEEMALEHIHPSKAPFGYIRNSETGHLEINILEAESVKRIFELSKQGLSIRNIVDTLIEENSYLKNGKWHLNRVQKILDNKIYIGIFEYGKYRRKKQDCLVVENYCEPIITKELWEATRRTLKKNKHPNYGEHIHIFVGLIKCPLCNEILSASESIKQTSYGEKIYYHLRCKNKNCKGHGYHYNVEKIEEKLIRVLDELTRYMYDMDNEILLSNTTPSKDIENIKKAISKLEEQEKRLVDLYIDSNLNVEVINQKNEKIKKDIQTLNEKLKSLDPNNDSNKEYIIELMHKLECEIKDIEIIFPNKLAFSFLWKSLNKKSQKELLTNLISSIEINRDSNFNIEIKNIKFTENFINKNPKEYIDYLYSILQDKNIGIIYKEQIDESQLNDLKNKYTIISLSKLMNDSYTKLEKENYMALIQNHFYVDGIIERPLRKNNTLVDNILLIPRTVIEYQNT